MPFFENFDSRRVNQVSEMDSMEGIRKIYERGKEIIVLDFSNQNENGMMALVTQVKNMVLTENRKQLIAVIYTHRNFGTPRYMNHVREESKEVMGLIEKMANVGLSPTQKLLLKGYSFFFKRNFKAFDTLEDAVRYLTDDTTTDHDIPDYMKAL
jgi:hypothetical protein